MITKLRKMIVLAGVIACATGAAFAGAYHAHVDSGQTYSGGVDVPTSASCSVNGGAWSGWYYGYDGYSASYCSSPLGVFDAYSTGPTYYSASGTISAGYYPISMYVTGLGAADVSITW